jgi:hypothetical protein
MSLSRAQMDRSFSASTLSFSCSLQVHKCTTRIHQQTSWSLFEKQLFIFKITVFKNSYFVEFTTNLQRADRKQKTEEKPLETVLERKFYKEMPQN